MQRQPLRPDAFATADAISACAPAIGDMRVRKMYVRNYLVAVIGCDLWSNVIACRRNIKTSGWAVKWCKCVCCHGSHSFEIVNGCGVAPNSSKREASIVGPYFLPPAHLPQLCCRHPQSKFTCDRDQNSPGDEVVTGGLDGLFACARSRYHSNKCKSARFLAWPDERRQREPTKASTMLLIARRSQIMGTKMDSNPRRAIRLGLTLACKMRRPPHTRCVRRSSRCFLQGLRRRLLYRIRYSKGSGNHNAFASAPGYSKPKQACDWRCTDGCGGVPVRHRLPASLAGPDVVQNVFAPDVAEFLHLVEGE